jgi:hypothetical protein
LAASRQELAVKIQQVELARDQLLRLREAMGAATTAAEGMLTKATERGEGEFAHELEAMQTGMRDLRRQVEMLLAQTSDTSAEDGA